MVRRFQSGLLDDVTKCEKIAEKLFPFSSNMRVSFRFVHWRARCPKMSSKPFMLDKEFRLQPGHQSRESGGLCLNCTFFIKSQKRLWIFSRTLLTMQRRMCVILHPSGYCCMACIIINPLYYVLLLLSIIYLLFVNILGCSFKMEKQRNVEMTLMFLLSIWGWFLFVNIFSFECGRIKMFFKYIF